MRLVRRCVQLGLWAAAALTTYAPTALAQAPTPAESALAAAPGDVSVRDGRPWQGSETPVVVLTLVLDPSSGDAARAWGVLSEVLRGMPPELALRVVLNPSPTAPDADSAARDLVVAASRGHFWSRLRAQLAPGRSAPLPPLEAGAEAAAVASFVQREAARGRALAGGAAPKLYVNATRVDLPAPAERIRDAIGRERTAARLAAATGSASARALFVAKRMAAVPALQDLPPFPAARAAEIQRWAVQISPEDLRLGETERAHGTLVLFADPLRPASAAAMAMAEDAVRRAAGALRLVWKAAPNGPRSERVARSVVCAGAQRAQLLRRLARLPARPRDVDLGLALADVGLDPVRTLACADAEAARRQVARDRRAAQVVAVGGGPVALFLDGERLPWPLDAGALDAHIARAARNSAPLRAEGLGVDAIHQRLVGGARRERTRPRARPGSLPSPFGR